jgi:hypothetical protein
MPDTRLEEVPNSTCSLSPWPHIVTGVLKSFVFSVNALSPQYRAGTQYRGLLASYLLHN